MTFSPLFLFLPKNYKVMKVIAKNYQVCSALRGVITPSAGGGITFSYGYSYGGLRFHDSQSFGGISELIVYLLDDCGYDFVTFRKK